jgi:serine/threonine protein kinase
MGIPGVGPGTVLADRYEIVRVIGQGGMGAVYEATHRTIKKRVALKLLRPEVASAPSIVQRFLQEARTANEVRHKNIVEVTDFGVDQGKPFLVMEFLEGEPLTNWLERHTPSPIGPLFALLLPVGRALDYAHTKGFIHRDVKPDNVFLARVPGERSLVPKVLDFGIAKNTLDPDVRLTSTQATMGTPLYMAPEQAGGAKDVTQAADQYAFAAMVYEALAGRPPHLAETYNGLIIAKVTAEPEPLVAYRPEIPEALAAIVQRALSRDPKQRFESMEALCVALEPFADEAVAVGAASAPRRAPAADVALLATAAAGDFAASPVPSAQTASEGTPTDSAISSANTNPNAPTPSLSKIEPAQSKAKAASAFASTEAPHEVSVVQAPERASSGLRSPTVIVAGVAALVAAFGVAAVARGRSQGSATVQPDRSTSGGVTAPVATPSATAELVFAVSPPEAEIVLDDRVIGRGTTRIDLPVDARTHSLRVRAPGYLDYQEASFVVRGPRAIVQQLVRDPALVVQAPDAGVASNSARPANGAGNSSNRGNRVHNNNGRLNVFGTNPLTGGRR